jgi:hypothetical protein
MALLDSSNQRRFNQRATPTREISTRTSTNGPITVAKAESGDFAFTAHGYTLWTVTHFIKAFGIRAQPVLVAFQYGGQYLMNPVREMGVQSVINPLALPTVRQQAASTQLRQVPGDFWLTLVQRAGQLANTKLSLTGDEHHRADPSVVSQAFENSGRCQMVSHIAFSVLVFDQDEHLDALMNFVKGVTEGIGLEAGDRVLKTGHCEVSAHIRFTEYMFSRIKDKDSTAH